MRLTINITADPAPGIDHLALLLLVLVVGLFLTAACSSGTPSPGATEKVQVVTSITVFADMAREVGGERVEVRSVLPPGADVHTFEASPADAVALTKARLVVLNGLGLDTAVNRLAQANAPKNAVFVTLGAGLESQAVGDKDEGPGALNPHFWLSAPYGIRYVERIRDGLIAADPSDTDGYRRRATDYIQRVQAVDSEVRSLMGSIPPERRKLVTFHDAFPYFSREYGLQDVGFVLGAEGGEASAGEVARLVSAIKTQGIRAVFREPQFRPAVLDSLASETGVSVGVLYNDALDDQVPTYLDLLRHNAQELARYLK